MTIVLEQPYATTRDSYDACARSYDAWCEGYAPYTDAWDAFIQLLPPSARVADLGCGSGLFLEMIKKHCPASDLEGFDYSSKMLDIARVRVPQAKFNQADIRTVMLPANSLDAIILSGCLTHLPPRETIRMLFEAVMALRPGGLLYATFTELEEVRVETGAYETAVFGQEHEFYCYRNLIQDVAAAFKGAGLDILEFDRVAGCCGIAPPWHAPEALVFGRKR